MNAIPQSAPMDWLDERLAFAAQVIAGAGIVAMSHFAWGTTRLFEGEEGGDAAGVADVEVGRLIAARLGARFPDDDVLAGEAGRTARADAVWVVEAIDGSHAFALGLSSWCIAVALVAEGVPELALVLDPSRGELFTARRGRGAWLNGRRIACADANQLAGTLVSIGGPDRTADAMLLGVLARLAEAGAMFHRDGSAALSLCQVAAGRLVGHIEPGAPAGSRIAGLLVVREAGGRVPPAGEDRIVASAPGVFDRLDGILG